VGWGVVLLAELLLPAAFLRTYTHAPMRACIQSNQSPLLDVIRYTVIFAVARTVGWVAQWREMVSESPAQKITRPRQVRCSNGLR